VVFFLWLVVYGALAGAIYALIALAFVVVYKSSRAINFAVGEWVTFGALLTASGLHVLALGLAGAILFAGVGMVALAWAFGWLVLRRMEGRPLMAIIMLTLGLGALMRGAGAIIFKGIPSAIALPIDLDYVEILGLPLPPERLLCAAVAGLCIAAVHFFYQRTRTGLALRAIAANHVAALGAGIDVNRHLAITWALAGLVSVAAGVLWNMVSGGGFGGALVGLKIFPIVVIGGLNSIPGCIVGAMVIGVAESLASGYLDAVVGSGVSVVVSSLLLLGMLWVRPHGLFGERPATRV
jgi:branched-chain amino acid transport system permease protein